LFYREVISQETTTFVFGEKPVEPQWLSGKTPTSSKSTTSKSPGLAPLT
jgi:hypothetical protein